MNKCAVLLVFPSNETFPARRTYGEKSCRQGHAVSDIHKKEQLIDFFQKKICP